MVLVDTSVWIDHLRRGDSHLQQMLCAGQVAIHPFVIGEIACGNLANRREILGLLQALPPTVVATHEEALALIEPESLQGKGLGWMDVHLLASARLSHLRIWTRDNPLHRAAGIFHVAHAPGNSAARDG